MNLMVVGGGGREHAIIKKLKENPQVETIYALPGNAGFKEAECVDIGATDLDAIVAWAKKHPIDFAVVAPDDPLVMGLVDRLEAEGIPCFGPDAKAAQIEGSKAFAKRLMKKYGIPTANFAIFDDPDQASSYLEKQKMPIVIKASGLAKGKGVLICQTLDQAQEAIDEIMRNEKFGKSGDTVVIEEFMEGPEISILAFTDGQTIRPMISSMDHKRAHDHDQGLNTGGMGAIAPNPYYSKEVADRCMKEIFLPTIRAMKKEGRPFKGCLYFGLMLTAEGPKVVEYNCRFGDPEAQVVLPLLKSDLLTIMRAVHDEKLDQVEVNFSKEFACCVILASQGYPESYKTGFPIRYSEEVAEGIFFAGVREEKGQLLSNGGRVLGYTALGENLQEAIDKAYRAMEQIHFDHSFYRKDIGQRALQAEV